MSAPEPEPSPGNPYRAKLPAERTDDLRSRYARAWRWRRRLVVARNLTVAFSVAVGFATHYLEDLFPILAIVVGGGTIAAVHSLLRCPRCEKRFGAKITCRNCSLPEGSPPPSDALPDHPPPRVD